GCTDRGLEEIAARLRARSRKTPPVDDVPAADRRDAEWVRADLVGEVQHTERTADGRLRHPVWRGWRPEKNVADLQWRSEERRVGDGWRVRCRREESRKKETRRMSSTKG